MKIIGIILGFFAVVALVTFIVYEIQEQILNYRDPEKQTNTTNPRDSATFYYVATREDTAKYNKNNPGMMRVGDLIIERMRRDSIAKFLKLRKEKKIKDTVDIYIVDFPK